MVPITPSDFLSFLFSFLPSVKSCCSNLHVVSRTRRTRLYHRRRKRPIIIDQNEHPIQHETELCLMTPRCLWKRLQRVANADADVAEWLWKLLHTTSRNDVCSQPLQKKKKKALNTEHPRTIVRGNLLMLLLLLLQLHPTISDHRLHVLVRVIIYPTSEPLSRRRVQPHIRMCIYR